MKTKILITVFLILTVSVAYFAYPIFKNRYFQSSESTSEPEQSSVSEEDRDSLDSSTTDNKDENIPDESTVAEDVFIEIDAEDCEDSCEQFEDADDKKYCQEYCGIQSDSTPSNDCDKLEDLEKDYCWKNQALTKKDFSLCKKIIDKKLLESCKTRLTEELINGSNPIIE